MLPGALVFNIVPFFLDFLFGARGRVRFRVSEPQLYTPTLHPNPKPNPSPNPKLSPSPNPK